MPKAQKSKKHHKTAPHSQGKGVKHELLPPRQRTHSISTWLNAWRMVAVFLVELCAFTALQASNLIGKRTSEIIKWCNRLWKDGSLDDLERSGRTGSISETDVEKVKNGHA